MLKIVIPLREGVTESNEILVLEGFEVELEHSLAALSKWESEFEKPFLAPGKKTTEEAIGYVRAMLLTPNVPEEVFTKLCNNHMEKINEYLDKKHTATWFSDNRPRPQSGETITAEIIYYWLTVAQIPWDPAQHWHLNKLFTLIRVFDLKSAKPQKMSKGEQMARQRELNAQRKKQMGTRG